MNSEGGLVQLKISRKALLLVSQIIAGLVAVSVILLFQLGAFAGHGNLKPKSTSEPTNVAPTLLEAPKPTPTEKVPVEEVVDPLDPGISGFNGETPAQRACQEQMRTSAEAANAVLRQAWQLWDQALALENTASTTADAAEAANLFAQAEVLKAEHIRLNDLGIQMQAERFGGHSGMGCGPNGIYYF